MSAAIPFSIFRGNVKQLETSFRLPSMGALVNACFSAFTGLDQKRAKMLEEGMKYLHTSTGTEFNFGYRPRRFSGGPGLPTGRYFTLCDQDSFNDHGTLRDELTAYYRGKAGITATIFDPLVEPWVLDSLRKEGMSDESLSLPLYFITCDIHRRTIT
jgi:hypothetical protein